MRTMNQALAEIASTGCPATIVLEGGWSHGMNVVTGILGPIQPEDTTVIVSTIYQQDGVGWEIDSDVPPTFVAIDKITRVSYKEG